MPGNASSETRIFKSGERNFPLPALPAKTKSCLRMYFSRGMQSPPGQGKSIRSLAPILEQGLCCRDAAAARGEGGEAALPTRAPAPAFYGAPTTRATAVVATPPYVLPDYFCVVATPPPYNQRFEGSILLQRSPFEGGLPLMQGGPDTMRVRAAVRGPRVFKVRQHSPSDSNPWKGML